MKEIITKLPKSGEGNEYSDPQNQRAMKRLNIKRSLMSHTDQQSNSQKSKNQRQNFESNERRMPYRTHFLSKILASQERVAIYIQKQIKEDKY